MPCPPNPVADVESDTIAEPDAMPADPVVDVESEPAVRNQSEAYRNAVTYSDRQNSQIEHDALQRNPDDNPAFRDWLTDRFRGPSEDALPVGTRCHARRPGGRDVEPVSNTIRGERSRLKMPKPCFQRKNGTPW